MENKIITGLIAIVAIVVAVIFAGCITLDTSSPSGVVETFASLHRDGDFEACYFLMSAEYKNLTDESIFKEKMSQCKPHFCHYEFVEVRNGEIDGDYVSVEVVYVEKKDLFIANLIPENKTKTINLTKEEGGWRLTDLHCELKAK